MKRTVKVFDLTQRVAHDIVSSGILDVEDVVEEEPKPGGQVEEPEEVAAIQSQVSLL